MVSTAAGLASTGLTVFANSFAMFVPGRCYDQIRLQLAYGRSNVKLVGVSAGLTQGPDGATHQSMDDVALMRQLPHMTVLVPADATETFLAVIAAAEMEGPVYIRLGRYPTPVLFGEDYSFTVGAMPLLRAGVDVSIMATGIMVAKALEAAELLSLQGIEASVSNVATIKPLNTEAVLALVRDSQLAVTMEEQSIIGGLGSAVAEVLAESLAQPPLLRLGVRDCFGQSGLADELLEQYGLSPRGMVADIMEKMGR